MTDPAPSPVAWVQVMQALVARELVESFGLSERQAAPLLGIVPSSVSQYLSGKRLGGSLARHLNDPEARRLARRTAQALVEGPASPRLVLEATVALSERRPSGDRAARRPPAAARLPASARSGVPRWIRQRIAGEQDAVAECMRLAQRARDELTRALFRQIASDSLRHAEIVASLGAYLDRGISASRPTGVTRRDIDALLRREHAAEASTAGSPPPDLGGVMQLLWESMEADERKHELLLQGLRAATPPAAEARRSVPVG